MKSRKESSVNKAWALALCMFAAAANATPFCRVVSAGSLAFGNYDPLSPMPNDTAVTVRVACDGNGTAESVMLDIGLGTGANSGSTHGRRMGHTSKAESLQYELFRDPGRSSVWGNTSGLDTVTQALNVPARGTVSVTFTIYARAPAHQDVAAGSYTDSIQLTLSP